VLDTHTRPARLTQPCWSLHYGSERPLATVIPDPRWPEMFASTGRTARFPISATCERGPPARNARRFTWKRSERPVEAPPVDLFAVRHVRPTPAPNYGAAM
jgi:hypothetical protein